MIDYRRLRLRALPTLRRSHDPSSGTSMVETHRRAEQLKYVQGAECKKWEIFQCAKDVGRFDHDDPAEVEAMESLLAFLAAVEIEPR